MTHLVWLFLFINVYWWGNSSSDNLVLAVQIVRSTDNNLNIVHMKGLSQRLFLYTKGFIFAELFLVFVSNIFLGLYLIYEARKNSNFVFNNLEKFWRLPLRNQITLFLFTVSIAVPNRVFINNPIKTIYLYFLMLVYLFLGFFEPFLWIIFIQYVFIACFSWVFAYFYETFEWFRERVNILLFENNISLSKKYFNFFWGNMNVGARKATGAAAAAAATMGGLNVQRNHELDVRQKFADKQFIHAVKYTSMKDRVITPQEMMSYKEAQKAKWTQTDGVILKLEANLRDFNPFWPLGE